MLPVEILNAIQASGRMVNEELSQLFSMDQYQVAEEHDDLVRDMMKVGHDRATAVAYLEVMPLMVERKAISAFLADSGRDDLRLAMPNLETPMEAALVGTLERNLSPAQSESLLQLLASVYR